MSTDEILLKRQTNDVMYKAETVNFVLKDLGDATPTGEFEAVFSTFDVIDAHGDIVLSSAFRDGQEVPIVWHHDWSRPVGRGVIKVDIGRAVIVGRFFLETTAGLEAYKMVKAMGNLQEYSWGFHIEQATYQQRGDDWVRLIQDADTYEVSPVLRGAGKNTGTLAMKSGQPLKDHFGAAQAVVKDMVERVKSLADLRMKEGRTLSTANRERLAALRDEMTTLIADVDDLLAATEPAEKAESADDVAAVAAMMQAQFVLITSRALA